jgi:Protein of unknown function DUF58
VVRNTGRLPMPPLRVTDAVVGLEPIVALIPSLRANEEAVALIDVRALARGTYGSATSHISVATPIGLVSRRLHWQPFRLIVHPRRVRPLPLTVAGDGGMHATIDRPGRGVDVHGLRPWHRGDAAGSVHWRSSARRDELMVLERAEEECGGLAILVGPFSASPEAEDMIARAAATTVAAMREGRRVGLFAARAHPVHTSTDRMAVLDWFAGVQSESAPGADVVASAGRTAGSGGIVLWLSTLAPPADVLTAVRRSGVTLVPVLPAGRP